MRISRLVAVFAPLIFFFSASSKAQDKIALFGGYSFVHAPVTATEAGSGCVGNSCITVLLGTHLNLHGWEASGEYKTNRWLGLTADFSGHYGSAIAGNAIHIHTHLFGPQVSLHGRVSPFAHALFGGAHESIGNSPSLQVIGGTQSSFATGLGVGIDIKVLPSVSVRAIQFDYLLTRFNSSTQNQPRLCAGIVFHL